MVSQGVLPFQCEVERAEPQLTNVAGLLPYVELMLMLHLRQAVDTEVAQAGDRGWTDGVLVLAVILLNLVGGSCVDDLERLGQDAGFRELLRHAALHGLNHAQQRRYRRRFRRGGERTPTASPTRRYLSTFHDAQAERGRVPGTAFIPPLTAGLRGLALVNGRLLQQVQHRRPEPTATLDLDATLVGTTKRDALYCYKGYQAVQPLNVRWAETGLVVYTEFRDGNVPAGFENQRVLQEALDLLPTGVRTARLRSDTAAYQTALLRYCAEGQHSRFGVIEFAIGVDVTAEFKRAVAEVEASDWRTLRDRDDVDHGQEWAEVCFVPNALATRKGGPTYRFLAIRERLRQLDLPGLEQQELPFPTTTCAGQRYKLFGVVTNRTLPGDELIRWYRERCGRSEHVHAVMKHDLAGGRLPSELFGANAAWWWMMVLALNLDVALKLLTLGPSWFGRRMKATRFLLIQVAARVRRRGGRVTLCFSSESLAVELIVAIRRAILALACGPAP